MLHELRYLLASGDRADATFAHHGHEYLAYVTAGVGVLAALLLGRMLVSVATGIPARRRRVGVTRLWLLSSAALLAVYMGQELLEGVFAADHPAGLAGVFGAGGLIAVPLSLAVGGAIALLVRVARAVQDARSGHPLQFVVLAPAYRGVWHARALRRLRGRVLAEHIAGRAPPVAAG